MMRSCLPCILLALVALPAAEVTVRLTEGSTITAPLLRQDERGVVLDLGSQVLLLDRARIASISESQEAAAATATTSLAGIATVGRLAESSTTAAMERHRDAVVKVSTPGGLGSGFFISSEGHLITNYHVVERQTKIRVTFFHGKDGEQVRHELERVRILATHPLRDLALLQIDREEIPGVIIPHVVFAAEDDVAVGDRVVAVGNPLGLERSTTQGIVSSRTRTLEHLRFIQTDASINPGNSGGPIFNGRGEVVAVVCAGFVFFDGLAFGIPAPDVLDFLRNREAYLYDPANPQNGITYLPPPAATAPTPAQENP